MTSDWLGWPGFDVVMMQDTVGPTLKAELCVAIAVSNASRQKTTMYFKCGRQFEGGAPSTFVLPAAGEERCRNLSWSSN